MNFRPKCQTPRRTSSTSRTSTQRPLFRLSYKEYNSLRMTDGDGGMKTSIELSVASLGWVPGNHSWTRGYLCLYASFHVSSYCS